MLSGLLCFVLGLICGSFINSFIWRYQEKKSFKGRSMCPFCEHKISWYDNIPVLSWFFLSGRCRNCKKSISVQYPVVEIITGFLFAVVGVYSKPGLEISKYLEEISNFRFQISSHDLILNIVFLGATLFITGLLVGISVYDYKTKEIPNGFNLVFVILALVYAMTVSLNSGDLPFSFFIFFSSGLVAFAFFWAFVYFSKETWMGGGDAKFAFGMGLLLGPAGTFLAILVASVTGSAYGLSSIGFSKLKNFNSRLARNSTLKIRLDRSQFGQIKNLSSEIPFGPFLALGTFVSLVFGPKMIDFYVKMILGL